ncbi:MAG: hypothetical protein D6785_09685, partial [Planctomycetota bacterium]
MNRDISGIILFMGLLWMFPGGKSFGKNPNSSLSHNKKNEKKEKKREKLKKILSQIPFRLEAKRKEMDFKKGILGIFGEPRIWTPYFVLMGDGFALWIRKKSLTRVYGENIFLYSPEYTLKAAQFYYDFEKGVGKFGKMKIGEAGASLK